MSDDEEVLDPRVQEELDRLNAASEEINLLENKLDEANALFRSTLSDSTSSLKLLANRLGSSVEKARPYYEARRHAKLIQQECHRAAIQFQRASVLHQNAKETIQLAEQRFLLDSNTASVECPPRGLMVADRNISRDDRAGSKAVTSYIHTEVSTSDSDHATASSCVSITSAATEVDSSATTDGHVFEFDNAWQEMLNHATMKLLEAEQLKISSQCQHQARAATFSQYQVSLLKLERSLERSIRRSRAYFEQREAIQQGLARQKQHVLQLQRQVMAAKQVYSISLRRLEHISEDIHNQRRLKQRERTCVCRPIESLLTSPDANELLSEATESATSDYAEDFRLSQEQHYWNEVREQIEAISTSPSVSGASPGHRPTNTLLEPTVVSACHTPSVTGAGVQIPRGVTSDDLAGDNDLPRSVTSGDLVGDKNPPRDVTSGDLAGDKDLPRGVTSGDLAGDKDLPRDVTSGDLAGDKDLPRGVASDDLAGDKDLPRGVASDGLAGDKDLPQGVASDGLAGDKDLPQGVASGDLAGNTNLSRGVTPVELSGGDV